MFGRLTRLPDASPSQVDQLEEDVFEREAGDEPSRREGKLDSPVDIPPASSVDFLIRRAADQLLGDARADVFGGEDDQRVGSATDEERMVE